MKQGDFFRCPCVCGKRCWARWGRETDNGWMHGEVFYEGRWQGGQWTKEEVKEIKDTGPVDLTNDNALAEYTKAILLGGLTV